jgi:putative transcriptional regulator
MNPQLFQELLQSLREAVAIERGELEPARVTLFPPVDVKAVRGRLGLTQLGFSRMIGVSLATLRNWEQGRRSPHGPAKVLLIVAAHAPAAVLEAIRTYGGGAVNQWLPGPNVLEFALPQLPRAVAKRGSQYVESMVPADSAPTREGDHDRACASTG